MESARIGLNDGQISEMGALMGILSTLQIGLPLVWMGLIVRRQTVSP